MPSDHLCNNADVVRAFYALLQQTSTEGKSKSYENSGKRWSKEDDELLKQLFEQGMKKANCKKDLCVHAEAYSQDWQNWVL